MTTTRRAATAAAALAGLSLAACSFSGSASAVPPTRSTTTTAVVPGSAAPAGSPTTPATGPTTQPSTRTSTRPATRPTTQPASTGAGATVPRCSLSHLVVALGTPEGAAGSQYVPLTFRNTGDVCRLDGHPGVDGLRADGVTIHADRTGPSSTGSTATPSVTLLPDGHASALLRASDVPTGSATTCPADVTALLVTPPDLTRSARLSVDLPSCGGLVVGPVVPGTQG